MRVPSPSPTDPEAEVETRIDTPAARAGAAKTKTSSPRPGEKKTSAAASAAAANAASGRSRDSVPSDAPTANSRPLAKAKDSFHPDRPSAPPVATSSGAPRTAFLLAAAVVVAGAWFFLRTKERPAEPINPPAAAIEPAKLPPAPAEPAQLEPAPAPEPEPVASAAVEAEASAVASASAAPSAEPAAAPVAAASAAPTPAPAEEKAAAPEASGDLVVVTVTAVPPDARFFYKGRAVSGSPMRVELKPGEKRSFEIGRPGFRTRKVVVDGSQKEMTVGMRPEAARPDAPAP
jgi:pyruvate dehydrogenase E2 component (dihydrolipoamide acetyltransferase)